ncbi:glioma pathogenesis-related protein 1 [Halichoeres trimaculatus]|uniref:glioma pathogenesis-related protein 1 n=1 Tax=Halichoeres trimaculatus TaxID=147232 RepID=UPI003D9E618B
MSCILKGLLLAWITLNSWVCSVTLPQITDRRFIDDCVQEHNRARSSVNPPASNMQHMTWDKDLAITARKWASNCLFEHNPSRAHPKFTSVGENIWTGYPPSIFEATSAIKSWDDEKQHYNYSSQACSKMCGHYTQVVWASSNKVGCAANLCPGGVKESGFGTKEGVIFVCNYAPAGNVNRRKPYESKGSACSGCEGTCVNNLCSTERTSESGSNYVAVLVVRPIALILTFIAAYAVKHFYPDIFCYE